MDIFNTIVVHVTYAWYLEKYTHVNCCTNETRRWRDAVQNTTSTSSWMSLTFHNKVGLTNSVMHAIYLLNSTYKYNVY